MLSLDCAWGRRRRHTSGVFGPSGSTCALLSAELRIRNAWSTSCLTLKARDGLMGNARLVVLSKFDVVLEALEALSRRNGENAASSSIQIDIKASCMEAPMSFESCVMIVSVGESTCATPLVSWKGRQSWHWMNWAHQNNTRSNVFHLAKQYLQCLLIRPQSDKIMRATSNKFSWIRFHQCMRYGCRLQQEDLLSIILTVNNILLRYHLEWRPQMKNPGRPRFAHFYRPMQTPKWIPPGWIQALRKFLAIPWIACKISTRDCARVITEFFQLLASCKIPNSYTSIRISWSQPTSIWCKSQFCNFGSMPTEYLHAAFSSHIPNLRYMRCLVKSKIVLLTLTIVSSEPDAM